MTDDEDEDVFRDEETVLELDTVELEPEVELPVTAGEEQISTGRLWVITLAPVIMAILILLGLSECSRTENLEMPAHDAARAVWEGLQRTGEPHGNTPEWLQKRCDWC